MFPVVHNVVFQHAENAAFLWSQRMDAIHHPAYQFSDLKQLDTRLSANLRGLSVSGPIACDIVEQLVAAEEEGALFVLLVLLLEQSTVRVLIDKVSNMDLAACPDALQQAVAWVNPESLAHLAELLVEDQHESVLLLALAAHSTHRKIPQPSIISRLLGHKSLKVRVSTLNLIAALRLDNHADELASLLCDIDAQNMAVARGQLYTGQRSAAQQTLCQLQTSECYRRQALDLLLLTHSPSDARDFLKPLFENKQQVLDVIRGFGLIGDPSAVPWLIEQTMDEKSARQSGAAIAMITGVDLALEDLDREHDANESEEDDPHAPIAPDDPDDDLAWPDTDLLRRWWSENKHWQTGQIYLMGCKADETGELDKVLTQGKQPHRAVAAVRRALKVLDEPVFDETAPGHWQSSWM